MGRWLMVLVVACAASSDAWGQDELPDIADRNYAIDLYQGAVLGSARIVSMGGASVALGKGSSGVLVNPAAVAVWPETSIGEWDWDFHFDYLNRLPGEDLDNNGFEDPNVELSVNPFLTFGLAGRISVFAVGVTVTSNTEASPSDDSIDGDIEATTEVLRFAAGANLFRETLALGAAIKLGSFKVARVDADSGDIDSALFDLRGLGLEFGAVWMPANQDFRVGAAFESAVAGSERVELGPDECDPNDCDGYILPDRVVAPFQLTAGIAYRFGQTRWNQKFGTRWRDERHWTLSADMVITGSSNDGHGVGAFAQRKLQRSGENVSVSAHLGAEFEWIPGWLRLRAGTYYEPGRFRGSPGRVHATGGLDVRVYSFCFWDGRYRLMLGLTGDGAVGYGNGGVTVGFWH